MLKHQIAIRTFSEWDEARPGFLEIDLVGHEGGNPSGDFCQGLDMTDVATGWRKVRAVRNYCTQRAITFTRSRLGMTTPFGPTVMA